jgi:hypothetical protein
MTANTTGPCDTVTQQQLTNAVLQEVTVRTSPQHVSDIELQNATCSTNAARQAAIPKASVSIYNSVAVTVWLLDSLSDLQAALQLALGSTFTLGDYCLKSSVCRLPTMIRNLFL